MSFQLVRAEDTEIAVWNVEYGHIFTFSIPAKARELVPGPIRDVPGADEGATTLKDAALRFATAEARSRQLIR